MTLRRYFLNRFLSILPLLFFLPFLTFLLMQMAPGNYFDNLRMNPQISEVLIERYESQYHLDEPVVVQYLYWLGNVFRLDFGFSFAYQQPVTSLLAERLWNTFLLTGTAFLIAWVLAVIAGLWAGMHRGHWADSVCAGIAYFGLSVPNFFLCLVLLSLASTAGGIPLGGMQSIHYESLSWAGKIADRLRHMLIPVFVLSLGTFAYLFRMMRAQTQDVAGRDFVFYLRTLRVPERKIIFKHVGRNAINPMITLFGLELPALFSGAALVEIFTGWPGLGSMMLQAVRTQDQFLVLGNILMIAVLLVLGNLLADIMLAVMDPRTRLGDRHAV